MVMQGNPVEHIEEGEQLPESTSRDKREAILGNTVEEEKKEPENATLVAEAVQQGITSFIPSLFFEQLVRNYKQAKELYGERLLAEATGYSSQSLERNIRLPEVQRQLKEKMEKLEKQMKKEETIDDQYAFTEQAMTLATQTLFEEELDTLVPKGIANSEESKQITQHGTRADTKPYTRERYRDISLRKSIKKAVKRKHTKQLHRSDLYAYTREDGGKREIIYCLDSSGSMKGEKIRQGRRAGLALAYKAIEKGDYVGLVIFNSEIRESLRATKDFPTLAKRIIQIKAAMQTNIVASIKEAETLFSTERVNKHIILITDALATTDENPEEKTLIAVSEAKEKKIILSVIGIRLTKKGEALAKKMVAIGGGRLFMVQNIDELQQIVLHEYQMIQ